MSMSDRGPIPESIRDQAADWLARNQGDHPEASEAAFHDWLSRDLRHRLAYAEAERAWRDSVSLGSTRFGRERMLTRAPFHMRRSTHFAALSLVVVLGIGLVSVRFVRELPAFGIGTQVEARSFQTLAGETRTWQLSDGTALTLTGAGLARSRFDASLRRIELVQGRARIRVASNDGRPVEVRAAALSISTRDAAFEISSTPSVNRIDVLSGHAQATLPGGELRSLTAGQGIDAPPAKTTTPTAQVETSDRPIEQTAEMTIGDAARQLNQHNAVQIHLAGEALASRRLVGAFRIDDPDGFADAVAALDDLHVERSPGAIFLKPR